MEFQEDAYKKASNTIRCGRCNRTELCLYDSIVGKMHVHQFNPVCPFCGSNEDCLHISDYQCRLSEGASYTVFECGSTFMINYEVGYVMAILCITDECKLAADNMRTLVTAEDTI